MPAGRLRSDSAQPERPVLTVCVSLPRITCFFAVGFRLLQCYRCGNVAAIMELDEHRTPNFKIFEGQQSSRIECARAQPSAPVTRAPPASHVFAHITLVCHASVVVTFFLLSSCTAGGSRHAGQEARTGLFPVNATAEGPRSSSLSLLLTARLSSPWPLLPNMFALCLSFSLSPVAPPPRFEFSPPFSAALSGSPSPPSLVSSPMYAASLSFLPQPLSLCYSVLDANDFHTNACRIEHFWYLQPDFQRAANF